MCTCEICVLLAALLEPLCMYLVNLSIKDASRHAEPVQALVSRSESGVPFSDRRARRAGALALSARGTAALSARGAAARPSPRTPSLTGTAHG